MLVGEEDKIVVYPSVEHTREKNILALVSDWIALERSKIQ